MNRVVRAIEDDLGLTDSEAGELIAATLTAFLMVVALAAGCIALFLLAPVQ